MHGALQHVGVLGMRWGIRRSAPRSVSVPHPDHTSAHILKKKKLHEMSNEEIRRITTRMQLEKQYRDLNPQQINKGKKVATKYLGMSGSTFATTVITGVGTAAGAYVVKQILKKTPFG